MRHPEYLAEGLAVAGVTRDSPDSNERWTRRLGLAYPLLSDADGRVGRSFGVTRRLGIGEWKVEFFRRTTVLIDAQGTVSAVWARVKVRGHAAQVLEVARVLPRTTT